MCLKVSNNHAPIYSTIPHNTKADKNNLNGLSLNFFNKTSINTPPNPYIGSHGPYREPLFTNTPSLITCIITSYAYPINENIKKNNIKKTFIKMI